MQKITDKIKLFIGVLALCLLFSFNLIHALNDYGVSNPNNKLHPQVYAQTNTAGGGGTSNENCICGGVSAGTACSPLCDALNSGLFNPGGGNTNLWGRGNVELECRFDERHLTGCSVICPGCRGRWVARVPSALLPSNWRLVSVTGQCFCGVDFDR